MSVSKTLLATSISLAVLLQTSSAMAAPMQKEAGWSGEVAVGAGYMSLTNSEVAGNKIVDLEQKKIENGAATPDNETAAIPVVNFQIRYTLASKKTEIFLGNDEGDSLRLDNSTALGVRHDYSGMGIMGVRLLFGSSLAATEVYEDPLDATRDRKKTDRTTVGIGLKWEKIMASNFDVDLRVRKIDIDKDRNGDQLVDSGFITASEGKDLERDGDLANLKVSYTYVINKSNILVPFAMYTDNNRDGKARDFSQGDAGLAYVYMTGKFVLATSVSGGQSSFSNKNPVFDDKQDTTFWSVGSKATFAKPFGMKNWDAHIGALASEGNSDISFYSTKIRMAYASLGYKF